MPASSKFSTVYKLATASVSGVGSLFGSSKDISEQDIILDYKFNLFKFIKNMDYKDEAPIEYTFNLFKFIKIWIIRMKHQLNLISFYEVFETRNEQIIQK